MEGFTNPSDADREFDELRARAYGPNPDIDNDLPALARLRELEAAAHRTDAERGAKVLPSATATDADAAPTPTVEAGSVWALLHRATATWRRRLAWAVGALVLVGGIVATVLVVAASRTDPPLRPTESETLHPSDTEADSALRSMVDEEAFSLEIDSSTLRAYGSYRGLEIWSGENAFASPCLLAVHEASDILSEWRCAPTPADLIMDVSSSGDGFEGFDGLAGAGIIRFMLRGDTVDADVYLMAEAG